MTKLQYKTKPPKKGYTHYESNASHELTHFGDKNPPQDVQRQALNMVNNALDKLICDLDKLGYDMTKVRFSIHFKGK